MIKQIYDVLSGLLPRGIRKKSFAVNIGEMLAYAQRKPEATAL
jgi:hypothetical protein